MANIVDIDTNIISQIASRIAGLTSTPEDIALLGMGGQILQRDADGQAVLAGLISSSQAAGDAAMLATVAPINAQATNWLTPLQAAISANLARMNRPLPCLMTAGYYEDGGALDVATQAWPKKVINYRDEAAGLNYRLEVAAAQTGSGGRLALFSLDISTGVESLLWSEAMNTTTTGYDRAFIVVPLKTSAGAGPYPCVISFVPSQSTTFKVWCWDGATKTSYTSSSHTANSIYFVYDGTKQCFYWSNNSATNLRILYANAEQLTPSGAESPNGVSFTNWNTDIFPAAMRGRMWFLGNSNQPFQAGDIGKYCNLRLAVSDGPACGVGWLGNVYTTGNHCLNGLNTGRYYNDWNFFSAANMGTNFNGSGSSINISPVGHGDGPGVSSMFVKRPGGVIETECLVYKFQYDTVSRADNAMHFWPTRMDWQLIRHSDWRAIAQGYIDIPIIPRTANITSYQIYNMIPQWIDPTWARLATVRSETYNAMSGGIYQTYHEKWAY